MNASEAYWRELGLWPLWVERAAGEAAWPTPTPAPQPASGQLPPALLVPAQGSVPAGGSGSEGLGVPGAPSAAQVSRNPSVEGLTPWEEIQQQVRHCQRCALHHQRQQTVFGTGDAHPVWLFVGEGPGAEEDRQGLPFVGESGQLLDQMLRALGLNRSHQVYIANVVKCRPPHNRTPTHEECQQCLPYLAQQIRWLRPQIIVALGRVAAQALLASDQPLSQLRGQTYAFERIPVRVTWHPAYLLRNPADKAKAWEDLCQAQRLVKGLQATDETASHSDAALSPRIPRDGSADTATT